MINNTVPASEQDKVARAVRTWLNTYPDKPVDKIDFEYTDEESGMFLSTIQGSRKIHSYIDGSYEAQYQFKIVYRTIPVNAEERLQADEVLNKIGAWCESSEPTLETGMQVTKIKRDTYAALLYPYENGAEDHHILLTMNYEVNNNG